MKFELSRLVDFSDQSLIAEVQRVVALLPPGPITRDAFESMAKVSSDTVVRRFGGWREVLERSGFPERYGGRVVSDRMRSQPARGISSDEMLRELRRVAEVLGAKGVSAADFDAHAGEVKASAIYRRFGSWNTAIEAAGLEPMHRYHTDDDYFENLLEVWTHHGRAPYYREMDEPPSRITSGAYEHKFGTWTAARLAFLERVSSTEVAPQPPLTASEGRIDTQATVPPAPQPPSPRSIPVSTRWRVLTRDNFRCVGCGASPAITVGVRLHVDHITAVARGGTRDERNLQTLCQDCNLGKGSRKH